MSCDAAIERHVEGPIHAPCNRLYAMKASDIPQCSREWGRGGVGLRNGKKSKTLFIQPSKSHWIDNRFRFIHISMHDESLAIGQKKYTEFSSRGKCFRGAEYSHTITLRKLTSDSHHFSTCTLLRSVSSVGQQKHTCAWAGTIGPCTESKLQPPCMHMLTCDVVSVFYGGYG